MIRYFSTIVLSFAIVVGLALAQDNPPAKKNPDVNQDAKKDEANPADAKKGDGEGKADEPREQAEDPKEIIKRLTENFEKARGNLENKNTGDGTRKTQKQIVEDIEKLLQQQNNGGGGGGGGGGAGGPGGGGGAGSQGGASGQGGAGSSGQQKKNQPMVNDTQNNEVQGGGKIGPVDKKDPGKGKEGEDQKKKDEDDKKKKDEEDKKKKGDQGKDPKDDKDKNEAKGGKDKNEAKGGKDGDGDGGKGGNQDRKEKNTIADLHRNVWGHLPENRRKEMDAFSRERFVPRYEDLLRAYYDEIAGGGRRKDAD